MEQQEELAGAEPGEGEVAGAPPDPAPIMEILPLADVPAEEEDTQAPVVDVDDHPAADPHTGLHLNPELVRGLAKATSNVVVGRRISGQQGGTALTAAPQPSSSLGPVPFLRQSPRVWAKPYVRRPPAATPPASSGGGSGLQRVVYTGPYLSWNPSPAQLCECNHMLRGEGHFNADAYISCLPTTDRRRVGNHKWLCKWEGCGHIMTSQGEIRAHALTHLDLHSAPICSCSKSSFSNAKTLGYHLRGVPQHLLGCPPRPPKSSANFGKCTEASEAVRAGNPPALNCFVFT